MFPNNQNDYIEHQLQICRDHMKCVSGLMVSIHNWLQDFKYGSNKVTTTELTTVLVNSLYEYLTFDDRHNLSCTHKPNSPDSLVSQLEELQRWKTNCEEALQKSEESLLSIPEEMRKYLHVQSVLPLQKTIENYERQITEITNKLQLPTEEEEEEKEGEQKEEKEEKEEEKK
jgi:hypothetical protein